MKRPPITSGKWIPFFDNPLSALQGHTIKADNLARTSVAEAFKGRGASAKGVAEQKANARAIAALPDCLAALEFVAKYHAMQEQKGNPIASQLVESVKNALIKAGYEFP